MTFGANPVAVPSRAGRLDEDRPRVVATTAALAGALDEARCVEKLREEPSGRRAGTEVTHASHNAPA